VREAEAALRDIQLRRGDTEIEKHSSKRMAIEPRSGDGAELLEATVDGSETSVAPESGARVSHRLRVFIQSEYPSL
jgi:hypothetical protein